MSIARSELKGETFKGITTGKLLAAVHPGHVAWAGTNKAWLAAKWKELNR